MTTRTSLFRHGTVCVTNCTFDDGTVELDIQYLDGHPLHGGKYDEKVLFPLHLEGCETRVEAREEQNEDIKSYLFSSGIR